MTWNAETEDRVWSEWEKVNEWICGQSKNSQNREGKRKSIQDKRIFPSLHQSIQTRAVDNPVEGQKSEDKAVNVGQEETDNTQAQASAPNEPQ
jgi:hypothetical protein